MNKRIHKWTRFTEIFGDFCETFSDHVSRVKNKSAMASFEKKNAIATWEWKTIESLITVGDVIPAPHCEEALKTPAASRQSGPGLVRGEQRLRPAVSRHGSIVAASTSSAPPSLWVVVVERHVPGKCGAVARPKRREVASHIHTANPFKGL